MSNLILPNGKRPDLWLAVKMDPHDQGPGEFFVTHARNYAKFADRSGFTVLAHSYDRVALSIFCRQQTKAAGPAYQPKFSAFRQERPELVGDSPASDQPPPSDLSSGEDLDPSEPEIELPDGFLEDLQS